MKQSLNNKSFFRARTNPFNHRNNPSRPVWFGPSGLPTFAIFLDTPTYWSTIVIVIFITIFYN